jgi:hypothetical protein
VLLSDRTAPLREPNRPLNIPPLSPLASAFVERTNSETSVKHLTEVSGPNTSFVALLSYWKDEFLHLANPGGTWSLKRHYFDTLPLGIRIGSRVSG